MKLQDCVERRSLPTFTLQRDSLDSDILTATIRPTRILEQDSFKFVCLYLSSFFGSITDSKIKSNINQPKYMYIIYLWVTLGHFSVKSTLLAKGSYSNFVINSRRNACKLKSSKLSLPLPRNPHSWKFLVITLFF